MMHDQKNIKLKKKLGTFKFCILNFLQTILILVYSERRSWRLFTSSV